MEDAVNYVKKLLFDLFLIENFVTSNCMIGHVNLCLLKVFRWVMHISKNIIILQPASVLVLSAALKTLAWPIVESKKLGKTIADPEWFRGSLWWPWRLIGSSSTTFGNFQLNIFIPSEVISVVWKNGLSMNFMFMEANWMVSDVYVVVVGKLGDFGDEEKGLVLSMEI